MRPAHAALVVYRKELRDHLRDRRSMITALLVPLIGPALLLGIFSARASWAREDHPLRIPAVGTESAPNLVRFLERYQATVVPAPADYEARAEKMPSNRAGPMSGTSRAVIIERRSRR